MNAVMRDSSLDYRTYWLRNGEYYARRALGDVAPSAACEIPLDKLSQIPAEDRQIVIEEASADPAFCAKLVRAMTTRADWAHLVAASAKEAIVNELDPSRFGHRAGQWRVLRDRLKAILKDVPGLVDKIAKYRAAGRTPGLGQWDIIGSLVGAVAGAAGSIYTAKIQSDTQKSLQQAQLDAQMAQIRAQQAQALTSPMSFLTQPTIGGIPFWVLPVGAVAAYFLTKNA